MSPEKRKKQSRAKCATLARQGHHRSATTTTCGCSLSLSLSSPKTHRHHSPPLGVPNEPGVLHRLECVLGQRDRERDALAVGERPGPLVERGDLLGRCREESREGEQHEGGGGPRERAAAHGCVLFLDEGKGESFRKRAGQRALNGEARGPRRGGEEIKLGKVKREERREREKKGFAFFNFLDLDLHYFFFFRSSTLPPPSVHCRERNKTVPPPPPLPRSSLFFEQVRENIDY